MWDFRYIISTLDNMGVWHVVLPFLLVFTLIYAVLQKSKILGKDENGKPRKNFNVIIALVMGLGFVVPSVTGRYPMGMDPVQIINNALPGVSLLAVAIVMVLLIIGIFGKELAADKISGWVVGLSLISVLSIFLIASGWTTARLPHWLRFLYHPEFQALIVFLLFFAIIIWFITREEKEDNPDKGKIWKELLKDP